jgi:phage-related protein
MPSAQSRRERLLSGVRDALQTLSDHLTPDNQEKLEAIDTILNELELRQDISFYRDHYYAGLTLLKTGIDLA